jgi:ferredoxin
MKARVIAEECIGDGTCVDVCPEVFEMGNDGLAHVKVDPVPPEEEEKCRQACEDCPVDAIVLEE